MTRGASVTLHGSASSDSDGTIASYAWIQTGGTAVTLSNAASANPTFTAPNNLETLTFKLTVTDNEGATAVDTTTVNVINTAPVAEAGTARTVAPGAAVVLNGGASSDSDGTIVAYSWAQTIGTAVTLSGADTVTPSFTAPNTSATLTFRLTVTDNDGATANDTVTVTVSAPVLVAPPPPADGGGGGGCSLSRDGSFEPLLLLAFLVSLVMICRRRGRE